MTIPSPPRPSAPAPRQPASLAEMMAAYERVILIKTIQACGGSRKEAAALLRVRRGYLYSRLRCLKINLAELPVRRPGRPRKGDSRG
ncbi:MAG TPA: hypothetical protein DCX12_01575 [Chloroflexi bacterium]|nr:hypothetical protein [Chloroflexota bacterium]